LLTKDESNEAAEGAIYAGVVIAHRHGRTILAGGLNDIIGRRTHVEEHHIGHHI
jgi:hypothetical protein